MEKNKISVTGKALRKPGLIAALLLTAISLSACIVPVGRDYRGEGPRSHWSNDHDWNGGGGGGWNHHH